MGTQQNIVDRIIRKDTSVLVYKRELNDNGRFVVAVGIDKKTLQAYLISYYGEIMDSGKVSPPDYQYILENKVNALDYYLAHVHTITNIYTTAKNQIREKGKIEQPISDGSTRKAMGLQ